MNTPPEYVTLGELFRHVSALRAELCLPPLKDTNSLGQTIKNKNVPVIKPEGKRKLYHLESALNAFTTTKLWRTPFNRPGTKAEIESREYIPLAEATKMFRCSPLRFFSAIQEFCLKAFRHPHTQRVWVNIKEAERVAFYRRKRFIYSVLPEHEADILVATRPLIPILTRWGRTYNVYFCPELSHLGSAKTAYKPRS